MGRRNMLTDIQKQVLKKIVRTLKKNKIVFQITGGLAAIAYGSKRPLYDIDIDIYQRDIEKARELLKQYLTKDFFHKKSERFDIYMMMFDIDGVHIDITQLEDWYYFAKTGEKKLMNARPEDAEIIKVEGIEIPVVEKDKFIAYKKDLARDTDLDDIKQILGNK